MIVAGEFRYLDFDTKRIVEVGFHYKFLHGGFMMFEGVKSENKRGGVLDGF